MKKRIVVTLFILFYFPITAQHEVIYHVFQQVFLTALAIVMGFKKGGNENWITSRSLGYFNSMTTFLTELAADGIQVFAFN